MKKMVLSGQKLVSSGQTVSGIIIVDGGALGVMGGTAIAVTIRQGQEVVDGGVASRTVVGAAGALAVWNGGTARNTQVLNGGVMEVDYRSFAYNTTVCSGGVEILSNTFFPSGKDAGLQSSGEVLSGGILIVGAYATVEDVTVESGGEIVLEGPYGGHATIENGARVVYADIRAGVTQRGATVDHFSQTVQSGGAATKTLVINGTQIVAAGGEADSSVLGTGGRQIVTRGGTVAETLISGGGSQTVRGTANNTTIEKGGFQVLSRGGVAQNVLIESGGVEIVGSGATISQVTIQSGGTLRLLGGKAAQVAIKTGGVLQAVDVVSGVTIQSSVVDQSYSQTVHNGGTVVDTRVVEGTQVVSKGGRALNTTVISGVQTVEGFASNTSVSYGHQDVQGGKAIDTLVAMSSIQQVGGGGKALGTVIADGGTQVIGLSGVSTSATISSGGVEQVDSGGTARATTVLSGGEVIYNGGWVTGATFQAGSTEAVLATAAHMNVTSGVTLAVLPGGIVKSSTLSGATEVISAYANIRDNHFIPTSVTFVLGGNLSVQATPYFNGPIALSLSGFGAGSALDLGGFQVSSAEKFVFAKGSGSENMLTVTDGPLTAQIRLFGQYVAAGFHHTSDGAGGTLITYTAPPSSQVTIAHPHR